MAKKKVKRKSRPIVIGHLEKVERGVFGRFQKQITECVKGSFGVYALYRRNKLYYIGLAGNLKGRIKGHLKDKHGGSWTHFSLYVFRRESHIRELESLLLRIAYPEGNVQKGKLSGSTNLKRKLRRLIKGRYEDDMKKWFEEWKPPVKPAKKKAKKKSKAKGVERPLRGVFPGGKMIYATYKGKEYKAWVYGGGTIKIIPSGQLFDSPSMAGISVTKKKTMNGWRFWKYKNENGELVYIDQLRKKRG